MIFIAFIIAATVVGYFFYNKPARDYNKKIADGDDVVITFKFFSELYTDNPSHWERYADRVAYRPSENDYFTSIYFSDYKELKLYKQWNENKKKEELAAEKNFRQKYFEDLWIMELT